MDDPEDDGLDYTPTTRAVSDAEDDATDVSSSIFDLIDLKGKTSKPGPITVECGDKDPEKFFGVNHIWSLWGTPVEDMGEAMVRLKKGLPKQGWSIDKYGPDDSPAKTLELLAHSAKKQFSVSVYLHDESKKKGPDAPKSLIYVMVTSRCFQVPDGQTVDGG